MTAILRRVSLFTLAMAAGALLLVGVFVQSWWRGGSDDFRIDILTGETRRCDTGKCWTDSLDTLEERAREWERGRKSARSIERYQTQRDRISRSRWLRVVAPLTACLALLAAVLGPRPGRRFALGHVVGMALVLAATAAALLAMGVFKSSEDLGDLPNVRPGPGYSLAFAGAVLAAAVGAWVVAPMVGTHRRAIPVVAALAVTGALLLSAGTVSTWCSATRTDSHGEVKPIRSATLLRDTYFSDEPVWLGGRGSDAPTGAVWAGRIAFAASLATIACGGILTVLMLRARTRRARSLAAGYLAMVVAVAGAAVILASSAWFVFQVPKLTFPSVAFLGWGPVLAVSGAILSGSTALWAPGVLKQTALPEAVATQAASP